MKKLFLYLFLLGGLVLHAQENEPTESQKQMSQFATAKRNELSIDVLSAIGIPALNPRYEYILGKYSGVGIDLFISLDGDDNFTDFSEYESFSLTPYYRQYFFSKEDYGAKGFYAEGFVKFFTYDANISESINNSVTQESIFDTSIGAGIGWKWISQSGFLVDLGIGVGRNLALSDNAQQFNNELQIRGGLNFGWRF
ncbi:hypothetical protein [Croceitalea vernalis]|uniref:DUF3575 domain-containing protein n=1 Tax=Croceitalea vernalis TaxID=3075599 RepID=A0ABU3BCN9_9FLAO|nr:hypothetical protein [Croceitalea sp. P007]MDT0620232.1 hypothetical protein [Croceitalea sp. P007]